MAKQSHNELVITRIFYAPREIVWKYWTDPEYFKKWWGPKHYTCPVSKIDFRLGGKYLHAMRSTGGQEFWSTGTYKEIIPMEKIVATDSFADENGNVVPSTHYGMEGFPLELEVTFTFEDLGGKTKMTLRHVGIENLDGEIREAMEQGWQESFDKITPNLSALLPFHPSAPLLSDAHRSFEGQEGR
jgi:uncharacterized protein YndB with AHSA1/START domain